MKYNYGDCVNDTLTLSAKLLNDLNSTDKVWITRISDQVEKCQAVAGNALNHFASKMCRLLYGSSAAKSGIKAHLIRQYYFSIDAPFRDGWQALIRHRAKVKKRYQNGKSSPDGLPERPLRIM